MSRSTTTCLVDATLDERSRTVPGQPIELPDQPFEMLRIEVLADNVGELSNYAAQPGVGFAEITIADISDDREGPWVRRVHVPADECTRVATPHLRPQRESASIRPRRLARRRSRERCGASRSPMSARST